MHFRKVRLLQLLMFVWSIGLFVQPLAAATINVDEVSPGVGAVVVDTTDGLCSLREAIINANGNNQAGSAECGAGSGTDTLVLPSSATFTLTDAAVLNPTCGTQACGNTGLPFITSSIVIKGNGSTIERDSALGCSMNGTQTDTEFRIFMIRFSARLVLEGTTVKNGCADGADVSDFGGGIYNQESLTVRNSMLIGNQGSAGGAINGHATIEGSTLSGNSARFGGAIWTGSFASLTIRNSTLSGNAASAWGGAIYKNGRTAVLENVTIADNTASSEGALYGNNTTYSVKNVILTGSCGDGSTAATWTATGSNFDSGTSCAGLFGSNFTSNATLNLGALADNGGTTQTRALGAGSDAVDEVAAADCTRPTDQRGVARPQGAACDAGAFEVLVAASSPQIINVDETSASVGAVVVDPYDGRCSIREALANANNGSTGMVHPDCEQGYTAGGDTIVLPVDATFTLTDAAIVHGTYGASGLPHITSTISIQGNGSTITRDGSLICNIDLTRTSNEFRIVLVGGGSDDELTLEDVTLANGCADGRTYFELNGGAIFNNGGTLTMRRSTLNRNEARRGAGVSDHTGTTLIEASTLSGNSAVYGGGIHFLSGSTQPPLVLRNSILSANSADQGGGFTTEFGIATLENVTFASNTANDSGGGVHNDGGTINGKNVIFYGSGCTEDVFGGTWNARGSNFDSGSTCSDFFRSNFTPDATLNLGPLADNGGPTLTHALGTGSAAIDAVPDGQCTPFGGGTAFTTDQRGELRALDGDGNGTVRCDAGAFEVGALSIADVTQTEGNTGSSTFAFTLNRGAATVGATTVQIDTADISATGGSDYTAIAGQTATIPDGASSTTVGVTVAGETVYEVNETFAVNLSNAGNGALVDSSGLGTITNDDSPPVFSINNVAFGEGDAGPMALMFTIAKTGLTELQATVDAASSDGTATIADNDYVALPLTTVSFAPGETVQTVTVNANGDFTTENDETFDVVVTNPTNATIGDNLGIGTILDDDPSGVTVSTTVANTSETGATDSFTYVLDAAPAADVTVIVTSGETTEGLLSDADESEQGSVTLTFTSADWNTPQTVTVTGQNDPLIDGDHIYNVTATTVSTDLLWDGLAVASVAVTNADDDAAGVTVSKTTGGTSETGTTDTFSYVLDAEPNADVVVTVTSGDTAEGLLTDADETDQGSVTLTFTPANWTVAQTVTVAGQDDVLTDGNQTYNVTATTASTDLPWDGLTVATVAVTNTDDDTPGVDVAPVSGLVTTEVGGMGTFDVVLNAQPAADVSIDFGSSDTTEGLVSTDGITQQSTVTLIFTAATWNVPHTVTLHGQDDFVTDGDQAYSITSSVMSSADATWNGTAVGDVAATNQDDEVSAITVTPTAGLITNEAGGTDSFTIVLTSQPTAEVVIVLSSSDPSEGTVTPTSVTFTSANWDTPQTVTATGVDEAIDDGDQAWSVVTADAVSTDATYGGAAAADVSVLSVDDDTRGITVTPIGGLVTNEAGGSDSFTIVLTSEPTADVVIGMSSSDPAEGVVAPPSVTFTSANWSVAQTVTVTGVDEVLADGDQTYTIVTADAVSTDPGYDGLVLPDVAVTNLDDETSANDSDGDGVDDVVEDGGPNGGDANDDGIPDSAQPSVATFPAANGNGYITLMSTCQLRDVEALLKDSFERAPVLLPYALVEFRLPCATADMTVLYHAGEGWSEETGYWKYGPETPGQALTTKWYQLPGVVFDTTTVAGNTVARASFTLSDGELGDDTGVDGAIVDQGGPGTSVAAAIPTASEWMLLLLAISLATVGVLRLK